MVSSEIPLIQSEQVAVAVATVAVVVNFLVLIHQYTHIKTKNILPTKGLTNFNRINFNRINYRISYV